MNQKISPVGRDFFTCLVFIAVIRLVGHTG